MNPAVTGTSTNSDSNGRHHDHFHPRTCTRRRRKHNTVVSSRELPTNSNDSERRLSKDAIRTAQGKCGGTIPFQKRLNRILSLSSAGATRDEEADPQKYATGSNSNNCNNNNNNNSCNSYQDKNDGKSQHKDWMISECGIPASVVAVPVSQENDDAPSVTSSLASAGTAKEAKRQPRKKTEMNPASMMVHSKRSKIPSAWKRFMIFPRRQQEEKGMEARVVNLGAGKTTADGQDEEERDEPQQDGYDNEEEGPYCTLMEITLDKYKSRRRQGHDNDNHNDDVPSKSSSSLSSHETPYRQSSFSSFVFTHDAAHTDAVDHEGLGGSGGDVGVGGTVIPVDLSAPTMTEKLLSFMELSSEEEDSALNLLVATSKDKKKRQADDDESDSYGPKPSQPPKEVLLQSF